jgi:hypothetical protein
MLKNKILRIADYSYLLMKISVAYWRIDLYFSLAML